MRDLLGGKGAGLAEMTRLGLPVPPGFTITTKACNAFARTGRFPPGLWKQVESALSTVEMKIGRRFGDPSHPLLVSVRSGAKFSMPGMMDTVLNLGLNDETVETLGRISNERFAWDSYRRLIAMFGRIVKDVDGRKFEAILERRKEVSRALKDTERSSDDLKAIVAEFKELYQAEVGEPFPQNGREQLQQAIAAVFRSWNGKRAVDYRNFNKIPHDLGTAANVQTMVFGNMGPDSGTGVAFTRNPSTGEKQLYGEFLSNAQGEDVVAGIRTPLTIGQLRETFPVVYDQFSEAAAGFASFDPDEAERMGRDEKKPVVLVRVETSPDDVHGILHSKGVLTARGGATSHAAVVTRGLGIPCVTGCESIVVDYDEGL